MDFYSQSIQHSTCDDDDDDDDDAELDAKLVRGLGMQQQMTRPHEETEEELSEVKDQLSVAERQRDRALNDLREAKKKMTSQSEDDHELNNTKKSLENANQELKIKDKTIESLRFEVDSLKQLEYGLSKKNASLHATNEELDGVRASMARTESVLCDSKKRIEELEAEIDRRKESEAKLHDSYVAQSGKLEQMNSMLEEYKLEVASVREKMKELEREKTQKDESVRDVGHDSSSGDMKSLVDEIGVLKNELKRAMEAEENSKKAMDDLAVALKEVVAESQKTKEKLKSTEQQLEAVKEQAENLKNMVNSTEQSYETLLKESKKENDQLKNIVDRLRVEAEESILAWSGKEIEFVNCIKTAETDKYVAQEQNKKLIELLRETEEISNNSKEELRKLRDILGQALNEANMAKEAASIAKEENSYLKDSLVEKDKALVSLAQETERLRINEAEANESIKELKRIIASGSKKEAAKIEKESKELKKAAKKDPTTDTNEKEPVKERRMSGTFSFDLNQFWPALPGITTKASKEVDEDPEKDDALGGSIFDLVESPTKEPPHGHHRRNSSSCSDDGKNLNFENFEEGEHFDDMEIDRNSHGKRKALLRRFGDLLKRKNYHSAPKDSPKEVQPPPPKEISV